MQNPASWTNKLLNISLEIVSKSHDPFIDKTSIYIAIAQVYQQLNQLKKSESIIKKLLELQQKHESHDFYSFQEIAKYYLDLGDKTEAVKFLQLGLSSAKKISDYEERDHILTLLGEEFSGIGEFAKSLECSELIEDDFDRHLLYQYVVCDCIEFRQYAQVNLIVKKAKETGWENLLLEEIVKSYLKHKNFQKALEAIEMMSQEQSKVSALADIALKYWQLGNINQAKDSLSRAKEIVASIKNKSINLCCLQAISKVYQQIEYHAESNALTSIAVEEAKQIDNAFLQGLAFINLAFQLASVGKYEEAIKTIESSNPFIPKFEKIRLLIKIAKQLRQSNQFKKADRIIDLATKIVADITGDELSIPKQAAQSFALNDIADYALEHDLYKLAWGIYENIEYSSGKINLLLKISDKHIKNNQYYEAYKTLDKAERILWKTKNESDIYLASSIVKKYVEMGNYYSGIKIVKQMSSELQQAESLLVIASQYIKSPKEITPETVEMLRTLA